MSALPWKTRRPLSRWCRRSRPRCCLAKVVPGRFALGDGCRNAPGGSAGSGQVELAAPCVKLRRGLMRPRDDPMEPMRAEPGLAHACPPGLSADPSCDRRKAHHTYLTEWRHERADGTEIAGTQRPVLVRKRPQIQEMPSGQGCATVSRKGHAAFQPATAARHPDQIPRADRRHPRGGAAGLEDIGNAGGAGAAGRYDRADRHLGA